MPPCCYATLACVHMVQTTLPRLRAWANYHTHLPSIKRPPREQLLGYQVGDADDETTPQRGAWDVPANWSLPEKSAAAATAARTMGRRSSPRAGVRLLASNYEITASSPPSQSTLIGHGFCFSFLGAVAPSILIWHLLGTKPIFSARRDEIGRKYLRGCRLRRFCKQ